MLGIYSAALVLMTILLGVFPTTVMNKVSPGGQQAGLVTYTIQIWSADFYSATQF